MERETLSESLEIAAPESVGMSGVQLDGASDYVRQMVEIGAIPLAEVLVARRSRVVLHRSFVNSEVSARASRSRQSVSSRSPPSPRSCAHLL